MLAIKNGRVLTPSGTFLDGATVLVDGGKIISVTSAGQGAAIPAGAEVVDASGKYVLPGLIDASTRAGIHEDGNGPIGVDTDEPSNPISPQLRTIDAAWHEDLALKDALQWGVTATMVSPGTANIFGGQTFVMKTAGRTLTDMAIKNPAGMKVSLTGTPRMAMMAAMRGGPQIQPRDRAQDVALFQAELQRAREAMERQERLEKAKAAGATNLPEPDRNLRTEAIMALLRGEMPIFVTAHLNHDISNAIELAREWGLKLVLERCAEGHLVLDEIQESGAAVVAGPITVNRRSDLKNLSLKLPGVLARAGVKVAISTDHPTIPIHYLTVQAATAVREGMGEADALKAITINPAEILGVAGRMGSLEAGKDADVAVYSGHPFDINTRVELTYVNGVKVWDAASAWDPEDWAVAQGLTQPGYRRGAK